MATAAEVPSEEDNHSTCSICMEYFRCPKMLPCHHTFCLKCLEDLVRRTCGSAPAANAVFLCPLCRRKALVPKGGVKKFTTNFYISCDDMRRSQVTSSFRCGQHPQYLNRFLCLSCEMAICEVCKLTAHSGHHTKDLKVTAHNGQKEAETVDQLEELMRELAQAISVATQEEKLTKEKKIAVERQIKARANLIHSLAKAAQETALTHLNTEVTAFDTKVKNETRCLRDLHQTVKTRLETMRQSKSSESGFQNDNSLIKAPENKNSISSQRNKTEEEQIGSRNIVKSLPENSADQAKEVDPDQASERSTASPTTNTKGSPAGIRTGEEREVRKKTKTDERLSDGQAINSDAQECSVDAKPDSERLLKDVAEEARKLLKDRNENSSFLHLSLNCGHDGLQLENIISSFIGTPIGSAVQWMSPIATVQQSFTYSSDVSDDVYSIYVDETEKKLWACVHAHATKDIRRRGFYFNGKKAHENEIPNSITWKTRNDGVLYYSVSTHYINSKGHSPYRLYRSPGTSHSRVLELLPLSAPSKDATQNETSRNVMDFPCRNPLAFDVSHDDRYFAVIEADGEREKSSLAGLLAPRKVVVFCRHNKTPLSYTPPQTDNFYPSDVCFFVIGGVSVLLVSDWLGDSVHVLHVNEKGLQFVRHLAVDCADLLKPSAMATDAKGRLWIGCRGGKLFLCSPCDDH